MYSPDKVKIEIKHFCKQKKEYIWKETDNKYEYTVFVPDHWMHVRHIPSKESRQESDGKVENEEVKYDRLSGTEAYGQPDDDTKPWARKFPVSFNNKYKMTTEDGENSGKFTREEFNGLLSGIEMKESWM